MSIHYERDDSRQIVIVTFDGVPPSITDLRNLFQRHRAESVWHYGTLYDIRRMVGRPSFDYLRDLVANAAAFVPRGHTRGPVAFLTSDPALQQIATAFVEFENARPKIEVFNEIGTATVWLINEVNARDKTK